MKTKTKHISKDKMTMATLLVREAFPGTFMDEYDEESYYISIPTPDDWNLHFFESHEFDGTWSAQAYQPEETSGREFVEKLSLGITDPRRIADGIIAHAAEFHQWVARHSDPRREAA
jgi:hypothetical protein